MIASFLTSIVIFLSVGKAPDFSIWLPISSLNIPNACSLIGKSVNRILLEERRLNRSIEVFSNSET